MIFFRWRNVSVELCFSETLWLQVLQFFVQLASQKYEWKSSSFELAHLGTNRCQHPENKGLIRVKAEAWFYWSIYWLWLMNSLVTRANQFFFKLKAFMSGGWHLFCFILFYLFIFKRGGAFSKKVQTFWHKFTIWCSNP